MKIIRRKNFLVITFIGLFSGLVSFSFLASINYMLGNLIVGSYKEINITFVFLYLLILLLFLWIRRMLSAGLIRLAQSLFWQLRMKIIRLVLRSDYESLSKKKHEIHSALVHDVSNLTQVSLSIIEFITSSVIVVACLIYMAFLSYQLFFATLAATLIGVTIYLLAAKRNSKGFVLSRFLEDEFMKHFNALMNGMKEIYISPKKGDDIYSRKIVPISQHSFENNTRAFEGFLNNQITGQVIFYSLIGAILLIFSVTFKIESVTVVNFIFILLNLLGAIEIIMVLLPSVVQAKISLDRVKKLETELSEAPLTTNVDSAGTSAKFEEIVIEDLVFNYNNSDEKEERFKVGPVNLHLKKGEHIFIYGGNGSGKTTFMNTLLGLLKHTSGTIKWDQKIVENQYYQEYKKLFSVVFNDFYLFDEFYANLGYDRTQAEELLKLFELDKKIQLTETGFSTVDLSTGQRKRLALIAALLENKPIVFLDEWAADQDPYFRQKFYEQILPILKGLGYTIIAITHDDKYYACADRLFKMDFGQLIEETHLIKQKESTTEYEH